MQENKEKKGIYGMIFVKRGIFWGSGEQIAE